METDALETPINAANASCVNPFSQRFATRIDAKLISFINVTSAYDYTVYKINSQATCR
ncbi:hypothetical protein [Paenibacillus sp. ALJ109b]|uniref:hypothetical protein n=1 Tax=Paenibacillus sp. ALJ109b TaxID=2709068 RepID=UPI0013D40B97|nr:hypothetical protein [Paenibacillus sp. ALJ109b]NEU63895.1 hypothetical protein [Paenibacillus sp. ALJ109b]